MAPGFTIRLGARRGQEPWREVLVCQGRHQNEVQAAIRDSLVSRCCPLTEFGRAAHHWNPEKAVLGSKLPTTLEKSDGTVG